MRFSAAILLVLYLTQVSRPFMPYIEYLADYDRIATEECVNKDRPELGCNGKCYLNRQLQAASAAADMPGLPTPQETVEILVLHLLPESSAWTLPTALQMQQVCIHPLHNETVAQQFCGEPPFNPPIG